MAKNALDNNSSLGFLTLRAVFVFALQIASFIAASQDKYDVAVCNAMADKLSQVECLEGFKSKGTNDNQNTSRLAGGLGSPYPAGALKKGYITNADGAQCWFFQGGKTNQISYFYESTKGSYGVLVFDDPRCMSAEGADEIINKMMINNVIVRRYSHSDANFSTRVPEMRATSAMQVRGQCIQSRKYPAIGVMVDYIKESKSFTHVVHGAAVNGCD